MSITEIDHMRWRANAYESIARDMHKAMCVAADWIDEGRAHDFSAKALRLDTTDLRATFANLCATHELGDGTHD